MDNLHKLLNGVKGTLVKDFNPKYKTIELIESREIFPFGMLIGLFKFEKVKKDYGDRKIRENFSRKKSRVKKGIKALFFGNNYSIIYV